MNDQIRYAPKADGDIDAYYINSYGADLHGFIRLGTDDVTVGVTGISSKTLPFGKQAVADLAINHPTYRAKIIETAKAELARQFAATDPLFLASVLP